MTENDVMHDLECCANGGCKECSRYCAIDDQCDKLMADALSVIKMQKTALESVPGDIERLRLENERLNEALGHKYTKLDLIKAVNRIVRSFSDEEYDECDGDTLGSRIDALKDFVRLIGKENCSIVIGISENYPVIQYIEFKK